METRNGERKGETSGHDRGYKRLFSHPTAVEELRPWRASRDLESLFVEVPEGLRRYLPRLTYLLLDEGRLDLDRPGLERNRIAALFRIETAKSLEDFRRLTRKLAELLANSADPELRRTLDAWVISLFRRTFPGVIISETTDLEEVAMPEETAVEWRRQWRKEALAQGRQEGHKEGAVKGTRKLLLQQMTHRFGRLPVQVRHRVEEISSIAELSKLGKKLLSAKSLRDLGLA